MFPALGFFARTPCPERSTCKRHNCLFSHDPNVSYQSPVVIKADAPPKLLATSEQPAASTSRLPPPPLKTLPPAAPAKRPISAAASYAAQVKTVPTPEPPRKLQKVGPPQHSAAVPTATQSSSGAPVLRVSAAQSQVPVPVRQAMLKNLYDHFLNLYSKVLSAYPSLAQEHALRQEQEVYNKSNKHTYRNAVISSIAALKRRPFPDAVAHPSVGTEGDLAEREEQRKKMESLRLTTAQLESHIMTLDDMRKWGYIVEIPTGTGGDRPSEEGNIKTCERCAQQFKVKRAEEADECTFHWGRPYTSRIDGEKRRVYSCCSRSTDHEGCERGKHVFLDRTPEEMHMRHGFSYSRGTLPAVSNITEHGPVVQGDTALDIVALDCEMIYTTGGMRVARVSVVDSSGKEIFDELVKMDDGVEVIDFNTRFSGITAEAYAKALSPLAGIRKMLDGFINSRTIVIGHALENDLKTLRMVHHCCVDTAILFPHPSGAPYRHALRRLAKEYLNRAIQTGGATEGHSSMEDTIATLDLVRWFVLNKANVPSNAAAKAAEHPPTNGSSSRL